MNNNITNVTDRAKEIIFLTHFALVIKKSNIKYLFYLLICLCCLLCCWIHQPSLG